MALDLNRLNITDIVRLEPLSKDFIDNNLKLIGENYGLIEYKNYWGDKYFFKRVYDYEPIKMYECTLIVKIRRGNK